MSNEKQNTNFLNVNKFTNLKVKNDVLAFHNKGNIHIDKMFQSKLNFPPIALDILQGLEGYDTEISPFHHESIPCKTVESFKVKRNRSATHFSAEKISFSVLQTLLNEAFGANEALRRPYPSGGALYSVEALCCILQDRLLDGPETGIYHYRPSLHTLQLLQPATVEAINTHVLGIENENMKNVSFIFIYIINVPKALVKYRYRGYRVALMEVGAMFQQADLIAKELELCNKLSSSFNDHELAKFMALDNFSFVPAVMQLFGKAEQ